MVYKNMSSSHIILSNDNDILLINYPSINHRLYMEYIQDTNFYGEHYYAAPEVEKYEEYSQACDIWSLGMLLFEMVTLHTKPDCDYKSANKNNFGNRFTA